MKETQVQHSPELSDILSTPPPLATVNALGTVRVSVAVPASVSGVWAALTRRDVVARWFGELSESLKPGGAHRLDFGDGDFFEITDVVLDPPSALCYRWRFLGTGPSNAICWNVEPTSGGCRVTVTDSEPSRGQKTVEELTEGWTDFLERLRGYCATGQTTRYKWRREFDGSIELRLDASQAFDALFSAANQSRWLPWSGAAIASGAAVTMLDDNLPARFRIEEVARSDGFSLQFLLRCPEWIETTTCELTIQRRSRGALLAVSHQGWQAISNDEIEQSGQRQRFGKLWTQSLDRARRLIIG